MNMKENYYHHQNGQTSCIIARILITRLSENSRKVEIDSGRRFPGPLCSTLKMVTVDAYVYQFNTFMKSNQFRAM